MNGVVHVLRGGNKFLGGGGGKKIATLRAQNVKMDPSPP